MIVNFTVLIEQGEDGAYIATVPALKSCYTQADTIPELLEKTKEVIELCLEVEKDIPPSNKFIGVQQMEIAHSDRRNSLGRICFRDEDYTRLWGRANKENIDSILYVLGEKQ